LNGDKDLIGTEPSPEEQVDIHMSDSEKNAKKRLALENDPHSADTRLAITNSMLTDNVEEALQQDGMVELENKRYKMHDGTSVSGASNGSAASFEDDRRVQ
jgi:hypothetical protein